MFTNLSYEEIEGVLAFAIAEKARSKAGKIALTGISTFGLTLTSVYAANKKYNWKVSSLFAGNHHCRHDKDEFLNALLTISILPSLVTMKLLSNNLQKRIDMGAAQLTDMQNLINGLKALHVLKKSYVKENILSRIAKSIKLKAITNAVFYPVRSFTREERIQYLEEELERRTQLFKTNESTFTA